MTHTMKNGQGKPCKRPDGHTGLCCSAEAYANRLGRTRKRYQTNPEAGRARSRQWRQDNPAQKMVHAARYRAVKQDVPCIITLEDVLLVWRDCCAYCEEPWGELGSFQAPSLDKIVPALGYVPGNIAVVCRTCNVRKRDLSAAELFRLARNIEKETVRQKGLQSA